MRGQAMTAAETFRPGDRVFVKAQSNAPTMLLGKHGAIKTTYPGRGRNREKWYARVAFDGHHYAHVVALRDLARERSEPAAGEAP